MPWRPLVHVRDIALAYIAVLEAPPDAVNNRAFNVGTTTENYQVRDVARIVGEVVPGSRIAFADSAGPDPRSYRVDCSRIAQTLHNFKPQWTVRRGIQELYQALSENGLTLQDFEGERFKRIAHVQKLIKSGELQPDLRRAASSRSVSANTT
jgi:nucleoside-diphosphate-sugar epimerase